MVMFSFREMNWKEIQLLLTVSASCAVMMLTQSAATSRIFAAKHYQEVNENIELFGLSAANAAAALSGGFVVNGSPTQTAMAQSAALSYSLTIHDSYCSIGKVPASYCSPQCC